MSAQILHLADFRPAPPRPSPTARLAPTAAGDDQQAILDACRTLATRFERLERRAASLESSMRTAASPVRLRQL